MYKNETEITITTVSNQDPIALTRVIDDIIKTKNVIDISYIALQKEPCVYVYTAFIVIKN